MGNEITNFDLAKAFVFDFDGTLAILNIDFNFMREQVFDLIRRFGVREEMISQRHALEIIDEVHQFLRKTRPPVADEFYQTAHQILHAIEMEAAEEGGLLPGVEATLSSLKQMGFKVGIVTRNCEDAVRRVFPSINLFCDAFVSRNSVMNVKPHPDHLNAVMKVLCVSGEESVIVGDHVLDITAGKRVGARTIGVLTGRTKREDFEQAGADLVLKDTSEICILLKA